MEQERQLIKCPKCGNSLGVARGANFNVKTYDRGRPAKTVMKVTHTAGGRIDIECGFCGFAFSKVEKTLPMTYVVTPKKDKKGPVDKLV